MKKNRRKDGREKKKEEECKREDGVTVKIGHQKNTATDLEGWGWGVNGCKVTTAPDKMEQR